MGKHFIDPNQVFPCTMQIALFGPKLLPALFLKKPWYPCPFEIVEEALEETIIFAHSWKCWQLWMAIFFKEYFVQDFTRWKEELLLWRNETLVRDVELRWVVFL
jgi:hypothetical protein